MVNVKREALPLVAKDAVKLRASGGALSEVAEVRKDTLNGAIMRHQVKREVDHLVDNSLGLLLEVDALREDVCLAQGV